MLGGPWVDGPGGYVMSHVLKSAVLGVVLLALTGCFGDGTWVVGNGEGEMPPGVYTAEAGPPCHWARYQGGTPGFITAENWAVNRMFVEIIPQDNRFLSENCGTWVAPQAGALHRAARTGWSSPTRITGSGST